MAGNDIIYKRVVSRVTIQEEDKNIQTSLCFQNKASKISQTVKSVTHKTNLGINNKAEFTCDICSIVCSDINNFKQHIEGKKHNKKIKEQKILQQMGSISRNIQIPTMINYDMREKMSANIEAYLQQRKVEADQEISPLHGMIKTKKLEDPFQFSNYASCTYSSSTHCGACNMLFKNPSAYNLHIQTTEHYRKGRNLKEIVEIKDVKITAGEGLRFSCETCGKAFTGPVPFKQHLMSDSHSKKEDIMARKINEKDDIIVKEMMRMNILKGSELHCKDCGKKFSGIVSLDEHLRGSAHKRQIKKNYFLKNLEKEHREVLDYSMFGIHGEGDKKEGDVKLHCDTCHLGFRKTEDVQEHFTGVKHREATKVQVKTFRDSVKISQERESLAEEKSVRLSESEDSSDDPLIEL